MKTISFNVQAVPLIMAYLIENEVVIMPTDTIYGLHARVNYLNQEKLNEIKGRPPSQPHIILYSNVSQITGFINNTKKLDRFCHLDGLTTIVDDGSASGLAIRKINNSNPLLKNVLDQVGPLYSTSSNRHGEVYVSDILKIQSVFDKKVSLMALSENDNTELPSTIIDIRCGLKIIREGRVRREVFNNLS